VRCEDRSSDTQERPWEKDYNEKKWKTAVGKSLGEKGENTLYKPGFSWNKSVDVPQTHHEAKNQQSSEGEVNHDQVRTKGKGANCSQNLTRVNGNS